MTTEVKESPEVTFGDALLTGARLAIEAGDVETYLILQAVGVHFKHDLGIHTHKDFFAMAAKMQETTN